MLILFLWAGRAIGCGLAKNSHILRSSQRKLIAYKQSFLRRLRWRSMIVILLPQILLSAEIMILNASQESWTSIILAIGWWFFCLIQQREFIIFCVQSLIAVGSFDLCSIFLLIFLAQLLILKFQTGILFCILDIAVIWIVRFHIVYKKIIVFGGWNFYIMQLNSSLLLLLLKLLQLLLLFFICGITFKIKCTKLHEIRHL